MLRSIRIQKLVKKKNNKTKTNNAEPGAHEKLVTNCTMRLGLSSLVRNFRKCDSKRKKTKKALTDTVEVIS